MPRQTFDYDFEERAAILEFEAGYARPEAEALAAEMLATVRRRQEALRRDEADGARLFDVRRYDYD